MNKKYGIQSVPLGDYYPSFVDDCKKHLIKWSAANEDISRRIQFFLARIAKIPYREFSCFCCVYPHPTSSSYTVFIDIDNGSKCLLLSTIRDSDQYPNSSLGLHMLQNSLLLLDDVPENLLNFLHRECA